jgi:hypothetical protein
MIAVSPNFEYGFYEDHTFANAASPSAPFAQLTCYGLATNKWRITRQDKTRFDNTRELRVLLIHQLVLVCWRAVP